MREPIKAAWIGLAGAVVGGLIVAVFDYLVREREVDVKMIEIAVGILRAEPTEGIRPAREWAVNVISHYSTDVPLSEQARTALILNRVDPFQRIGEAALGTGALGTGVLGGGPIGPPPEVERQDEQ